MVIPIAAPSVTMISNALKSAPGVHSIANPLASVAQPDATQLQTGAARRDPLDALRTDCLTGGLAHRGGNVAHSKWRPME